MPQPNDLSRSLVALDQNSTIIAVLEMSQSSWLVDCGRDAHYWAPPAQNRTCGILASGSHLGCLTAKRWLGHG